jgi:uncharacterized protein YaaQ
MNKSKFFALIAVAGLMVIGSCKKDKEEAPVLSVSPQQSDIVFKADGTSDGNTTFTVSTNQSAWEAISSQAWSTVSKTATDFTVSAAAHTSTTAPAPATVTVTAGNATPVVISVTQTAAAPFMNLAPAGQTTVAFAADGTPDGNTTFTVSTNQSTWEAISSQTWCTVSKTANGFTVSAAANLSPTAPAQATVTVTAGEATPVVITVTQEAGSPDNDNILTADFFPDEAFRNYLNTRYAGNSGILTLTKANTVTVIDVGENTAIRSLEGVNLFVNLQRLSCPYTGITTLDLSGLTNLQTLNCFYTGITTLDLSGLTNLQAIRCYNTGITTLNLSGLTKLQLLWCSSTGITELDISANTALTYLNASPNLSLTTLYVWWEGGASAKPAQFTTFSIDANVNVIKKQ